jgi:general secretion pathway protein A
LSGQPELDEKLKLPQLRQLRQRINLRARLHPLSIEEARGYVAERLRIAGADGREIFTPEAIGRVHECTGGIPRLINLLCENALIGAFADQESIVTGARIEQTACDLELDPRSAAGLGEAHREREPTAEEEELLRQLAVAVQRIRREA